ncbi:TRAP transporter large permease, partial [Thermodesulfobacteriota bacterium]
MSSEVFGIYGLAVVILLSLLGMRIGFVLGFVGAVGLTLMRGWPAAFGQLGLIPYRVGSLYVLSTVPLFILMGHFAFHSGMSEMAFKATRLWLIRVRGGLGMATMMGCAAFAATSGSSVANSAVMGQLALPEMRANGYNIRFAAGLIAIGGTIGILIPPSTAFILYGIFTETSIGKLFAAGILPGLVIVALLCITISVWSRFKPGLVGYTTDISTPSWGERIRSLTGALPFLGTFFLVMGSIYGGIATPTEAASLGCTFCFLYLLIRGKLTWGLIVDVFLDTGRTTGMIFVILIGGFLFSSFMGFTGLPVFIIAKIEAMALPPYGVLAILLVLLFIMGMFFDALSMILITLPLIMPIIKELGFDTVWFGVIIVIMMEIAMVT